MHTIYTLDEMTQTARGWLSGGSVGFIPTMGYLHEGHMSLIRASQAECEVTVVSIYVNPLQFHSREEFLDYPRNLDHDLQLLDNIDVDVVFIPSVEDMQPPAFSTAVTLHGPLAERLEAEGNSAFVGGIATTMMKLLHLMRPDIAYLGQKDAQQAAIVHQLLRDLSFDVQLRVLPTVREADGLAISSRNILLTPEERKEAAGIYQALLMGKAAIERGELQVQQIKAVILETLARYPLVSVEYLDLCDPYTFVERTELIFNTILVLAVQVGNVRLLDNILCLDGKQWRL